jgi:hypothetical protein
MFLLVRDVTMDPRHLRLAHRERAISFLPRKSRGAFERSRDPARRIRFQFADDLGDRFILPQFRQDVDMIRRSINDQGDSLFTANCAAEVLMNSGTDCRGQPRLAALGRKDNMIEQIAIGGTHMAAPFRRPWSGALFFLHNTPGVPLCSTPGFSSGPPSGCCQRNMSRACVRFQIVNGCSDGTVNSASFSAEGAVDYSPECSAANSGIVAKCSQPPAKGDGEWVRIERRAPAGQMK